MKLRHVAISALLVPLVMGCQKTSEQVKTSDNIRLESPMAKTLIKSPLSVTGRARGFWFFEATFPMTITDKNGEQLGQSYVTADGEWMTSDFVPFSGEITFDAAQHKKGYLVLKRQNASGLPENDESTKIPVLFSK